MRAIHLKADGTKAEVIPKNNTDFSLKELQAFVGGTIDIRNISYKGHAWYMVVNDNGLLEKLPPNEKATELWTRSRPHQPATIVGDVLISPRTFIR